MGRKRCDVVAVFSGIVWVLVSGARWEDIDKKRYASGQTCHRYFAQWVREGVFQRALEALVQESQEQGLIQLHESFIDGSFVEAGYREVGEGGRRLA